MRNREINTLQQGVLKVSAYANFYPVCFKRNGKIVGLDIDIMKKYCKAAGLKLKVKEKKSFDGIWLDPIQGTSDTAIGGIGVTDKRTKMKTSWTIPYFYVYRTMIYNKADPIEKFPKDINGIVRGTKGSTGWIDAIDRLSKAGKTKYLKPGSSDDKDISALLHGKVQGLVRGSFVGKAIVKKYPQLGMVKPWSIESSLVSSDGEVFAYPCHTNSGLSTSLSTFLTYMTLTGELTELVKKYKLE